jgi:bacteriocin-like protein
MKSTICAETQGGLCELTTDELELVSGGGIHIWHKGYGISITSTGITIGIGNGNPVTLWFE